MGREVCPGVMHLGDISIYVIFIMFLKLGTVISPITTITFPSYNFFLFYHVFFPDKLWSHFAKFIF